MFLYFHVVENVFEIIVCVDYLKKQRRKTRLHVNVASHTASQTAQNVCFLHTH